MKFACFHIFSITDLLHRASRLEEENKKLREKKANMKALHLNLEKELAEVKDKYVR